LVTAPFWAPATPSMRTIGSSEDDMTWLSDAVLMFRRGYFDLSEIRGEENICRLGPEEKPGSRKLLFVITF
jgi:hypothetical protein